MKPPVFQYHNPDTLDGALKLLKEHGDEARILAGGQSLVPMLNMRLARPSVLVDINRISELAYIREDEGWLAFGALARQAEAETSGLVRRTQPLLADALGHVGHLQIRARGTVCGSLAHADPSSELGAVWTCLDGRFRIASKNAGGSGAGIEYREVDPEEFFLMYFTTSIQPEEMLVEARLPQLPEGAGWSFQELARRHGDFALVAAACTVTTDDGGAIDEVRLALTGVDMVPVRMKGIEDGLKGEAPSPDLFRDAGRQAAEAVDPESDIHASAQYRRHLAGVLTERALTRAAERAGTSRRPRGETE